VTVRTAIIALQKREARRLVPGRCEFCGCQFFYRRIGRPRNFCDRKCRQADFRRSGYLLSQSDESPQKSEVTSKASRPDSADRPQPWRVVAGPPGTAGMEYPNPGPIGLELKFGNRRPRDRYGRTERIIATEIPERKLSSPPTPGQLERLNDFRFHIPDDLSIPPFLKRDNGGAP